MAGDAIVAVDLLEGGEPRRTSAFIVRAPRPALVETGGSRSAEAVLAALAAQGIAPEDVAWIAVTHVHVDHAGGAGTLAARLPNAKVVVHPRGARHLADPSRLVAGTRDIHGDDWLARFGPVEPVPEDRLFVPEPGLRIDLGGGYALECLDAPGHAFHHFAFFEPETGTLFTGDAAGIVYPDLSRPGDLYLLASTAPNQFDPDLMVATARRLAALPARRVAFSHFGLWEAELGWVADRLEEVVRGWLAAVAGDGDGAFEGPSPSREAVRRAIWRWIEADLARAGRPSSEAVRRLLARDVEIDAGGYEAYLAYLSRQAHGSDTA
ncbi:MAG: MBL fold metallo-hydrolase [Clostridia bacterium]|nr:MBL fold metallo-hydrolase [Clostridia bacterium]